MEKRKKEKLEKNGWKVGDVDEFLGLSPAEMAIVEMKVALAKLSIKDFPPKFFCVFHFFNPKLILTLAFI